ncbi:MAG TPA: hypothetical protein VIG99_12810 [Myxococcaceae bacterium]|jgi:hypothetical protein
MRAIAIVCVVLGLGLSAGCASTPAKPAGPRLWQFQLPARTSIDILLSKTVDLNLTTPQVGELVKLQAELNEKVKPIREQLQQARGGGMSSAPPPGAQPGAPPPAPPSNEPPPGPPLVGPTRWVGAVRNSGDVGVPREPHVREAKEVIPADYADRRTRMETLIKQFDTEDQAAYERAEAGFDESQKAAARKLMADRAAERTKQASNNALFGR